MEIILAGLIIVYAAYVVYKKVSDIKKRNFCGCQGCGGCDGKK